MKHEIIINQTTTKEELFDAIRFVLDEFQKSRNPELEPEQDKQTFILAMYQSHIESRDSRVTMYRNCKTTDLLHFADFIKESLFEK